MAPRGKRRLKPGPKPKNPAAESDAQPPGLRGVELWQRVLALTEEHPDWTKKRIAEEVRCSRRNVGVILEKYERRAAAGIPLDAPNLSRPLKVHAPSHVSIVRTLRSWEDLSAAEVNSSIVAISSEAEARALSSRLRRLVDRCVAEIEGSLSTGDLNEQTKALKAATDAFVVITTIDQGMIPAAPTQAVQVNVHAGTVTADGATPIGADEMPEERRERLARLASKIERLGIRVVSDSSGPIVQVGAGKS